ncbi:lysophospholipid acyltransferase family protein [Olivibacter ginsenosidimutans]|uniref:Lysophospholipid acyltransferase family protein n=1 Tax=Olivibacter ginsenosidimutans TaxID=1176537 RepID=A0ABP9BF56_9SPHI
MVSKLIRKIHLGIYVFWVVFFFILFYPLLAILARNPKKNFSSIAKYRRQIARLSTWCSGFRFKFNIPYDFTWNGVYIICANHTSILDISALAILCKQDISFMGKIELLRNPITRFFFKTIDIPVDRRSKISSYKAFKLAQQRLAEGKSVVIFPEGKIEDTYPPVLQDFKNGPFKLAIENNIPILPVVINGLWKLLWDEGSRGSRPGHCTIHVLEPIETTSLGIAASDQLKDYVHQLFANYLMGP